MPRRVIDLSQPLSRESQLHPFFAPTQILRHIQHADARAGDPSFNAEVIITSNHAATHVDAIGHYLPGRPLAPGDAARHVLRRGDLRRHPRVPARARRERGRGGGGGRRQRSGASARATCSSSAATTTTAPPGRPPSSTASAASPPKRCHWMADRGVKIFGVETISPDLIYLTDPYPTHRACARARADPLREPQQPHRGRRPPVRLLRLPAPARDGRRLARARGRHCGRVAARRRAQATSSISTVSGSVPRKTRRNSACVQARFGSSRRSKVRRTDAPRTGTGRPVPARGRAG